MRPYIALFRMRARTLLTYRVAALAGLCTQWVFGFILISVLVAFYGEAGGERPMTLAQSITYTWLGQAMLSMFPWNTDAEIANSVRDGSVAYDLARPLDLYTHWYARAIALRIAPTLLKSFPIFLTATFLLPANLTMQWPALPGLMAWLLSTFGALVLSASVTLIMQATLFWTVTGDGITRMLPNVIILLSGMTIPLPLFPDWLQTFLRLQPFAGIMSSPAMLFCGALPPSAVWETLALQLIWTAAFVCLGRFLLNRGLRKLTVAGG